MIVAVGDTVIAALLSQSYRRKRNFYVKITFCQALFDAIALACLAGIVSIDALTTVCLVRLRDEVHELAGHAEQVTANNYQRWILVKRRQSEES